MTKKSEDKKEEKVEEKTKGKSEKVKKLTQSEYEKKILDFAKKGLTSEKIGESLRKEGIHPKDYNKKISKILEEKNAYENPDLKNVEEKLNRIRTHFEKNKQDKRAMRERERIFAQLRKLKKYFKVQ